MAIGFSASGPSIFPGAYYTGRLANDPAGTVQPTATLAAGQDFYIRRFAGTRNRWGDNSGIALDPTNDGTFCAFNGYALTRGSILPEFPNQDGRWGTRFECFTLTSAALADLSVTQRESADPVSAGGALNYTIHVTNNGPAIATSVTLTDVLHTAKVALVSATPTDKCSGTTTVTCRLGDIPSGGSATVQINTTLKKGVSLTNISNRNTVSANETDPDNKNNVDIEFTNTRCFGKAPTIFGTKGDDKNLTGTNGADVIFAETGDDIIDGRGGNDYICGANGDDDIKGGAGDDKLSGGSGTKDSLDGGDGNDQCLSGETKIINCEL